MLWQAIWRAAARHREMALALTFVVIAGWELVESLVLERRPGATGIAGFILHSLQVALVVGVTWTVIRAWQERTQADAALAAMVKQVLTAQEEERRRIAYDIHDGIAPLIVSAKQHVETSRDLTGQDDGRARLELERAAQRLDGAIVETRRVLRALRPSATDSLGLSEAMRRALDDAARESGWVARFVDNLGDAQVPAAVETTAFRILQESLLNASRHARGRQVDVELTHRAGWLHLEVRDDGVGLDPAAAAASRGLGLAGMRERARLLGGACRIEGRQGGGTAVRVALPLRAEGAHATGR